MFNDVSKNNKYVLFSGRILRTYPTNLMASYDGKSLYLSNNISEKHFRNMGSYSKGETKSKAYK